jgi:hypothetical protein
MTTPKCEPPLSPCIDEGRLSQVMGWSLKSGSHEKNSDGNLCVMEAVAFVAGKPWSDSPPCACPVIGAFMRTWNDALPTDSARDRLLKPFIPRLARSKSTKAVHSHRGMLAADWLVRVWTPQWLDLVPALAPHAEALRELEEIADTAGLVGVGEKLSAARDASAAASAAASAGARNAAWDAARNAAWAATRAAASGSAWDATRAVARNAAWDAAWDAACGAAWDAARNAASAAASGAAWDATRAVARNAAWDATSAVARNAARNAAWDAAWDAAWAHLTPTVEWCQASAVDLVERMLAVTPESLRRRASPGRPNKTGESA